MSWTPNSFDEACRRAAGRRAYNKRRRLARAERILRIMVLQKGAARSGRRLAELLDVHESTISRDLKFIGQVRADFRRATGCEMSPRSFSWIRGALAWQTIFEVRNGVRVA